MNIAGSYKKLGAANLSRIEQYVKELERLFSAATGRLISLSADAEYDKVNGQFYFDDYPELKEKADKIVGQLSRGMQNLITTGTSAEWTRGTKDADGIAEYLMKKTGMPMTGDLSGEDVGKYLNNHEAALKAFQRRKIGGLGLSQKVWNIANTRKIETELSRSIADGTSAVSLAESMKELLEKPNELYRRVRDEFGVLRLSRKASDFHPCDGVYRSSYKNALRLARTEINMAYRNAEQESYADKDYVVGYEIKRSNHPYDCPVCEALAGKYPKTFKWNGWHPACRCYMVPILITEEEMDARDDAILGGGEYDPTASENYVSAVPDELVEWSRANEARISDARERGSLPYFFRDNEEQIFRQMFDPDGKMQTGYVEFFADRKHLKNDDGSLSKYGTREECRRQLAQWNELQKGIKEITHDFEKSCNEVLSEIPDARFSGIAFKSRGSAIRKADTKFHGDISQIEDLVRCNFSCSSANYEKVCDAIRSRLNLYKDLSTAEYMHQVDTGSGYVCRFMDVAFGNRIKGEIMVTPFEQLAGRESAFMAKKFMGEDVYRRIAERAEAYGIKLGEGHRLYEVARIAEKGSAEQVRLFKEIDKYYDSLRDKCDPFPTFEKLVGVARKQGKLSFADIKYMLEANPNAETKLIFELEEGYIAKREALHRSIITQYIGESSASESKIVHMLGGAPANGKSTLVDSGMLKFPKGSLVIDADKVKALIPEYRLMVESGNKEWIAAAANFVHEESSMLGKAIQKEAFKHKISVVIDGVNDGSFEKVKKNVERIKTLTGGYRVRADYVTLDTNLSLKLAKARAVKTGRLVPEKVILNGNRGVSEIVPQLIQHKTFDELYLWDTNINGKARLILKQIDGKLEIFEPELYEAFLAKANK